MSFKITNANPVHEVPVSIRNEIGECRQVSMQLEWLLDEMIRYEPDAERPDIERKRAKAKAMAQDLTRRLNELLP